MRKSVVPSLLTMIAVLGSSTALFGCGDEPIDNTEMAVFDQALFDSTVEQFNLAYGEFADVYCDCYTNADFSGSRMNCEASFDSYLDPNLCELDVYKEFPEQGLLFIDCRREAGQTNRECLMSCPASDEARLECNKAVFEDLEICKYVAPQQMLDLLDGCSPP